MAGMFMFTPNCCCGDDGNCIKPCIPDCGVVYEGFVLNSNSPYASDSHFVKVNLIAADNYYKCGSNDDYRHYRIIHNASSGSQDSASPVLENDRQSGWHYQQTYQPGSGAAQWRLIATNVNPLAGLTVTQIRQVDYDNYPHSDRVTWYKLVFLPVDKEYVEQYLSDKFCFHVENNTQEDYAGADPIGLGTNNPDDYVVSDPDCGKTTLLTSCGESGTWSTNGAIGANGFANWISSTCSVANPGIDYTLVVFIGFRSWTYQTYSTWYNDSTLASIRQNHPTNSIVRTGYYCYGYRYNLPIVMDWYQNNRVFSVAANVDSAALTNLTRPTELNEYLTPAVYNYPEAEGKLVFGNENNIPTRWARLSYATSAELTEAQRKVCYDLDSTCDNDQRFNGEYYVYASGQSCSSPNLKYKIIQCMQFPLGVYTSLDDAINNGFASDRNRTPLFQRELSNFTSVNSFGFTNTTATGYANFLLRSKTSGGTSDDALGCGYYSYTSDKYRFFWNATGKTILNYTWIATLPNLALIYGKNSVPDIEDDFYSAFLGGSFFRKRGEVDYPLTAFNLTYGGTNYPCEPIRPFWGNGSPFSVGAYEGKVLQYNDVNSPTFANASDWARYNHYVETMSGSGSNAYRIINDDGRTGGTVQQYAVPKVSDGLISRIQGLMKYLYLTGYPTGDDYVFYPQVPLSAIIIYEDNE